MGRGQHSLQPICKVVFAKLLPNLSERMGICGRGVFEVLDIPWFTDFHSFHFFHFEAFVKTLKKLTERKEILMLVANFTSLSFAPLLQKSLGKFRR